VPGSLVTINLITPGSLYGDRVNELDLRFSKVLRFRNVRTKISLDMYNAAFVQEQYGYASVLAVILGVIGIAVAVGLVRLTGFASMASQQEGAA